MPGKISEMPIIDGLGTNNEFEVLVDGVNERVPLWMLGLAPWKTIENVVGGEFDFDGIPTNLGHNRIEIVASVRGSDVSHIANISIFFNGDITPSNYHRQLINADNGSPSTNEASDSVIAVSTASTSAGGLSVKANFTVVIPEYSSSDVKCANNIGQVALIYSDRVRVGGAGVSHKTLTAPVSRVQIMNSNNSLQSLTGKVSLYLRF